LSNDVTHNWYFIPTLKQYKQHSYMFVLHGQSP
jgi:hypothetical protein